jgi:hypothetical protein
MAEARSKRDFTDLAPWIYTIALFALWEAASRGLGLPVYILPAPSVVAQSIIDYWPAIWKNSLQTLYTTLVGFALAVAGGTGAGAACRLVALYLQGPLPADDRLQRGPQGCGGADPGDLVRHRHRASDPDRVSDRLLPDRGQCRHRPCHHRAGDGGRAAGAWRQEARHHAQGRHSALDALFLRLA